MFAWGTKAPTYEPHSKLQGKRIEPFNISAASQNLNLAVLPKLPEGDKEAQSDYVEPEDQDEVRNCDLLFLHYPSLLGFHVSSLPPLSPLAWR